MWGIRKNCLVSPTMAIAGAGARFTDWIQEQVNCLRSEFAVLTDRSSVGCSACQSCRILPLVTNSSQLAEEIALQARGSSQSKTRGSGCSASTSSMAQQKQQRDMASEESSSTSHTEEVASAGTHKDDRGDTLDFHQILGNIQSLCRGAESRQHGAGPSASPSTSKAGASTTARKHHGQKRIAGKRARLLPRATSTGQPRPGHSAEGATGPDSQEDQWTDSDYEFTFTDDEEMVPPESSEQDVVMATSVQDLPKQSKVKKLKRKLSFMNMVRNNPARILRHKVLSTASSDKKFSLLGVVPKSRFKTKEKSHGKGTLDGDKEDGDEEDYGAVPYEENHGPGVALSIKSDSAEVESMEVSVDTPIHSPKLNQQQLENAKDVAVALVADAGGNVDLVECNFDLDDLDVVGMEETTSFTFNLCSTEMDNSDSELSQDVTFTISSDVLLADACQLELDSSDDDSEDSDDDSDTDDLKQVSVSFSLPATDTDAKPGRKQSTKDKAEKMAEDFSFVEFTLSPPTEYLSSPETADRKQSTTKTSVTDKGGKATTSQEATRTKEKVPPPTASRKTQLECVIEEAEVEASPPQKDERSDAKAVKSETQGAASSLETFAQCSRSLPGRGKGQGIHTAGLDTEHLDLDEILDLSSSQPTLGQTMSEEEQTLHKTRKSNFFQRLLQKKHLISSEGRLKLKAGILKKLHVSTAAEQAKFPFLSRFSKGRSSLKSKSKKEKEEEERLLMLRKSSPAMVSVSVCEEAPTHPPPPPLPSVSQPIPAIQVNDIEQSDSRDNVAKEDAKQPAHLPLVQSPPQDAQAESATNLSEDQALKPCITAASEDTPLPTDKKAANEAHDRKKAPTDAHTHTTQQHSEDGSTRRSTEGTAVTHGVSSQHF